MMKKFFLVVCCFTAIRLSAQNAGENTSGKANGIQVIVEGQLDDLPNDTLIKINGFQSQTWDTCTIKNHRFRFALPIKEGGSIFMIQVGGLQKGVNPLEKGYAAIIYLDTGNVQISGKTFRDAKYTGSPWVQEWVEAFGLMYDNDESDNSFGSIKKRYYDAVAIGDEEVSDSLKKKMDIILGQHEVMYRDWIKKHPDSRVSGYLITAYFNRNRRAEDTLFKSLTDRGRESLIYRAWNEPGKWGLSPKLTLDTSAGPHNIPGHPKIGTIAPDIHGMDVDGKTIHLSDFKGKYILIDFWASWCGPCRASMPSLKASYEKVKGNSKFVLLGVSLDSKKEGWVKAINKDGLTWLNISNLKRWADPASLAFGIDQIPGNVLIGPDGQILAYNLSGDDLDKKLKEVLK